MTAALAAAAQRQASDRGEHPPLRSCGSGDSISDTAALVHSALVIAKINSEDRATLHTSLNRDSDRAREQP